MDPVIIRQVRSDHTTTICLVTCSTDCGEGLLTRFQVSTRHDGNIVFIDAVGLGL